MNRFVLNIYRAFVPKPVRTMIVKKRVRAKILKYYSSMPESDFNNEMREVVTFLHSHPLTIFPYQFHFNYRPDAVKVFRDDQRKMHYVYFDNKKLYFRIIRNK